MIPFVYGEKTVTQEEMERIYQAIKTPYKVGPVVKFETELCDSPAVFRKGDSWYMTFIKIAKDTSVSGYETHLAKSEDLIHWEYQYPLLRRGDGSRWDSRQIAGYAAYQDLEFGGSNTLEKVNGKYYMAYLGGNLDGYETDPLSMGLAYGEDLTRAETIERFSEPMLSVSDPDSRKGETLTHFKSNLIHDKAKVTGYPYVNAYNAKDNTHHESIYLAVSQDGEKWERYGDRAIINDPEATINGDPQIFQIGDLYVMVYFILKNNKTYNTFACSYDLAQWTVWNGTPLIVPECEWENVYAHKNWVIKDQGIVYHYYCAVNDKGERFIALATSEKLCDTAQ